MSGRVVRIERLVHGGDGLARDEHANRAGDQEHASPTAERLRATTKSATAASSVASS